MALIRDASRVGGITRETGLDVRELPEKGPNGVDIVIRNVLVDGQTGAGAASPSERSDGQLGQIPLNAFRCMVWYERQVVLPTNAPDRWTVIGPNEIHSNGGASQAPSMPEYGPTRTGGRMKRLNNNAGRSTPRYFDLYVPPMGEWFSHKFMVNYRNDANGWLEWWVNGVLKVRVTGVSTIDATSGYFKYANYRAAGISGDSIWDMSACRVYDAEVASLPLGGTPPPPPPPTDTAGPSVTVVSPTPNQQVPGSRFDWKVTADDPSGIDRVELYLEMTSKFRFATDTAVPFEGTYDITTWQRGNYSFYARAYDKAGNFTEVKVPVSFVTTAPPPDTTPPAMTFNAPAEVEFNGTIGLTATATDTGGVKNVTFSFGGATISSDTTSPYEVSLPANQYPAGTYTATAIAEDNAGNVTTISKQVVIKPELTTIERVNLDEARFLLEQIREFAQSKADEAETNNDLDAVQSWREVYGWAQRAINELHGEVDPEPLPDTP